MGGGEGRGGGGMAGHGWRGRMEGGLGEGRLLRCEMVGLRGWWMRVVRREEDEYMNDGVASTMDIHPCGQCLCVTSCAWMWIKNRDMSL